MAETRTEAEAFNNAVNATPSGVFTDGWGTQYTVIVDSCVVNPVAGINKYTFSMSLRKLS